MPDNALQTDGRAASRRPISAPTCRSSRRPTATCSRSSSRRRRSWTRCFCARSGPATRRCCSISRATVARRARAAALLPDQQGAVGSRLDHNKPFVPGAPPKPAGANFYPEGADESRHRPLDAVAARGGARAGRRLLHRHPPRAATRSALGAHTASSTSEELAHAAALLREAAALATEPTLKNFLTKRADAFLSNDYYDSDVAWMELKGAIEPTIGPYEVYEDECFNYKAAFESFITVQDEAESAKLQKFAGELQDIENNLPIDPKYRNPKLGGLAPIVVVNEVFAAGDANRGVQTAAFNLPNDERVVQEKGAKRVMLKNVQDAKFAKTLRADLESRPVAGGSEGRRLRRVLHAHRRARADARPRPAATSRSAARKTTVRQEIKEAYSYLEEAKADISGALRHSAHDRQRRAAEIAREAALHDVSRVGVPIDPIRRQRSARPRRRHAVQLPAGCRRLRRARGRHVRRRSREGEDRRRRPDARHHDDPGRGRLREGDRAARPSRRRPAARAEGARQDDGDSGRHRAASSRRPRSSCSSPWPNGCSIPSAG